MEGMIAGEYTVGGKIPLVTSTKDLASLILGRGLGLGGDYISLGYLGE